MLRFVRIDYNDRDIHILNDGQTVFLSLTDMAKAYKEKGKTVTAWLKTDTSKQTLLNWEQANNTDVDEQLNELLKENDIVSEKQKGLLKKRGGYSEGLYAELDIAFDFANWLNPAFETYIREGVNEAYKAGKLFGERELSEFDKMMQKVIRPITKK